jgi:hypothetical protein
MDEHDEPQRSGSTSADAQAGTHAEADAAPAAPVVRLLANPRRVRRT